MPARNEVLVHLVGGRVADPDRERRQLTAERPQEQAPRIAYSVMCAPLRRIVSQAPRPVPRLGIDENVKMTAAQTITGSQSETAREPGTGP